MIVLNVTYKCKQGRKDAFLKRLLTEGIGEACRAEEGNIQYDYYLPVQGGDELLLVEKWQDADALARHGGQPHMEKLRAFKAEYVEETIAERYDV